jgi:phospholipase C
MSLSRREFLVRAGAAGAIASVGFGQAGTSSVVVPASLPTPAASGIEHIVVLCMENRSFDHYLGWVPRAAGKQAGLRYADDAGVLHPTHRLTDWTGCGFNDPDHSYEGGRIEFADGKCDGFRKGTNDDFAIGYYAKEDLPTTAQLVDHFTTCDHWFASILGPTYPNRLYTHSAATDRITNTNTVSSMPTIWDRLKAKGVSAGYYFHDLPVLALYGKKYLSISHRIDEFFVQAALGTLPQYTYLDPSLLGESQGASNDDHPHADIRRGQNLVARIVQALTQSPLWSKTVFLITYDEWGGFFDHVPPPRFPDDVSNPGGDADNPDHGQAGFRVPGFIVSPFARPGVSHMVVEHSAILKLAEWRFGLAPLTKRDQASKNLATVLDFSAPNLHPPEITVPADPGPHVCSGQSGATGMATDESFWQELAASPLMRTWANV